jgi:hypothetical protein
MANGLNEEKKQQVLARGRLGWSLRHIQQATRIRRQTASAYLLVRAAPSHWPDTPQSQPLLNRPTK